MDLIAVLRLRSPDLVLFSPPQNDLPRFDPKSIGFLSAISNDSDVVPSRNVFERDG